MNAAGMLVRLGRTAEVLPHLKRAAEINPLDAEVQFQLGSFLASQSDFKEAVEHLKEVLRLQPDRTAARELINKIQQHPSMQN